MKNINISKIIVIALVTVILAIAVIGYSASRYSSAQSPTTATQIVNDGAGGIDRLFAAPGNFLRDKLSEFENLLNTYAQNESLKKQLAAVSTQDQQLQKALDENKRLQAALGLKNTLENYSTVEANVISRSPATWNAQLIIDKGSNDGLSAGMMVMANSSTNGDSNGGIIGRISQANPTNSKVELFTNSASFTNKIPIQIGSASNPIYGLMSSYDSSLGAFVITSVPANSTVKNGDTVVTSGLAYSEANSNLAPSNLVIGTVMGQNGNSSDPNRLVYVKPATDSFSVSFVTVIKRAVESN